jgi:hypothetical protein
MASARWQDRRQPKVCPAGCQQEHARLLDIPACFCLIYRTIILIQWLTTQRWRSRPVCALVPPWHRAKARSPRVRAPRPGAHLTREAAPLAKSIPARPTTSRFRGRCWWCLPIMWHAPGCIRCGAVFVIASSCCAQDRRGSHANRSRTGSNSTPWSCRANSTSPPSIAHRVHRVLLGERPLPRKRPRLALAPLTCVTVVKRLLGIDAPWVWTPWQLYQHLCGPEHGFRLWSEPALRQNSNAGSQGENSALDIAVYRYIILSLIAHSSLSARHGPRSSSSPLRRTGHG